MQILTPEKSRKTFTIKLKFLLTVFSFCVLVQNSTAQSKTISGFIKDAKTGEALIGANIYITSLGKGVVANLYGFYSITINDKDSVGVVFSYIGYQAQIKKLILTEDISLDITLESSTSELGEVVITGFKKDNNIEQTQMSVIDIPIRMIRELPAILGEADVLKVIQLLPGVQAGQEGTTGFFVRGGNADQNLVLLDGATVYNPNHLFGLFSTFNTRAINNVEFIKGGFPAQYGGRLSSIVDVSMKEGNDKEFKGSGGIGLITGQLTLEGPIQKNKSSFIISARRSYADLILKQVQPSSNQTSYYFYDVNAKINHRFSGKDRIYLSFFTGLDEATYTGASSVNYGIRFGNSTTTLRWNHLFGNKLFLNTSAIYNTYLQNLITTQSKYFSQLYSGINDLTGKLDFDYFPSSNHAVKFGGLVTSHRLLSTGRSASIPSGSVVTDIDVGNIPSRQFTEAALYINDNIKVSRRFSMNLGVRTPFFTSKDTSFARIEPRSNFKFTLDSVSSIKAAYTIMNQFLHLVPSSTASLPTDLWTPSSNRTLPQISQQAALGYFRNFKENKYEASVELYYKTMENQVAYAAGTQLIDQANIDDQLTYGKGWSYGVEFFVKKNTGRFNGWLSYTWSKTEQQFDDLNFGEKFPFKYDRRHNVSLVGIYNLNKKWSFSSNFVYSTGSAFTLPVGRINGANTGDLYDGIYSVYTERNNYRLNAYHRLDVAATYKKRAKIFKKEYDAEWVFSIYNLYSRQNTYYVFLEVNKKDNKPVEKQVSLLPIIPSVTYNFKF